MANTHNIKIQDIAKRFNNKVYSISGKSKKYPELPSEIIFNGGFDAECCWCQYTF